MKFCLDEDYPEIKVDKKDKNLAIYLLNSYAGIVSEDTAIHNYVFQMISQINPEIKKILHGIAIVEMHHLEILGKLLIALGLKPIFAKVSDKNLIWFSGKYVDYEMNLQDILLNNIKNEEEAIKQYEIIINKTDDINIKNILNRIIKDEQLHIEIFKNLLNNI